MKPVLKYALIASGVLVIGLSIWIALANHAKNNAYEREARIARTADSLSVLLSEAEGYSRADLLREQADTHHANAQRHYETIRRTPARAWDDSSLTRYLANPYPQGAGR